jgi:peptidoglycan/xylan/chitin deacetylase (PgdA/CDA1 family)
MDCFSGNLSAPLSALRAVGGFATDLARSFDVELGYRLVQYGLALTYVPAAKAVQHYDKQFRQIVTDAEREGQASLELYRRHPPMITELLLGRFANAPHRVLLLRRLLLALNVPVEALRVASGLVGRGTRARAWYGFVYAYAYWRAVRRAVSDPDTWERLAWGPVILMYHAFGQPGEAPSRYVVPVDTFGRQMRWLKRSGYRLLRLEELQRLRLEHRLPPGRSVVITIDDGYLDVHTLAAPILRQLGFPATVFLVSGAVGTSNRWDASGALAGRALMGWSDIHTLRRWTIDYGAHTRTHRALTSVPDDELAGEIGGSRDDLEKALGEPIVAFAYPYGRHNDAVRSAVGRAGFDFACGVMDGANTAATPYRALHRVEIYGTGSLVRFALAVWLGDGLQRVNPLSVIRQGH